MVARAGHRSAHPGRSSRLARLFPGYLPRRRGPRDFHRFRTGQRFRAGGRGPAVLLRRLPSAAAYQAPDQRGVRVTAPQPVPANVAGGRRDYPTTPFHAVPGLLRKLWFDRLAMLTDAADEFGDVVKFAMGPKTLYFFNHPDHAKHVLADNPLNYHKGLGLKEARKRILGDGLLTSEDEVWKRQRRIIQPAFRRDRIAGFTDVVTDAGETLVGRLGAHVGGTVDLSEEMTKLTMTVLGKSLLAADLSPLQMLGPAFEVAQDQAMFEMVSLGAIPAWLPTPRNFRFRKAKGQLADAVEVLVSGRAHAGGQAGGGDLLSLLASAYKDDPDAEKRWRVMRDELVTILLAGHET